MGKRKQKLSEHFNLRGTQQDVEGIQATADALGVTFSDAARILIRQGLAVNPVNGNQAA